MKYAPVTGLPQDVTERSDNLTIHRSAKLGIFFASGKVSIRHQLPIKSYAIAV